MDIEVKSISLGGRYVVQVERREARDSHAGFASELWDMQTGRSLFTFTDADWSIERAHWASESLVSIEFRKRAGRPAPRGLVVGIDCLHGIARIGSREEVGLDALESALKTMLTAAV